MTGRMTEPLKGRVAVVTGAGRGIGAATARQLAIMGARVVVNDPGVNRAGEGLDHGPADGVVRAIAEAGGTAVANYDSVADFESAGRIIETARREFGGIDILVNNAGSPPARRFSTSIPSCSTRSSASTSTAPTTARATPSPT